MTVFLIVGTAVLVAAALIMALGVFYALAMGAKITKAPTWPRAVATVMVSKVQTTGRQRSPLIEYRYRAGGQMRRCRNYRLAPSYGVGDEASLIVQAHPVGRELEIYYDPAMPNLATIELGGNARDYLRLYGRAALKVALLGVSLLAAAKFF
ncbi:MAG: DUF3592 domain-containing protein [Caulobacter sp.]